MPDDCDETRSLRGHEAKRLLVEAGIDRWWIWLTPAGVLIEISYGDRKKRAKLERLLGPNVTVGVLGKHDEGRARYFPNIDPRAGPPWASWSDG